MEMNAQATKLQAAEDELKRLMADVNRAMKKAEEAVARIAPKEASATAETAPRT
jgi:hypothetical protein